MLLPADQLFPLARGRSASDAHERNSSTICFCLAVVMAGRGRQQLPPSLSCTKGR